MKAFILYRPGDPEYLCISEKPIPTPSEGQVLVKVRAFGLNRSEIMTRKGLSPDVVFPRVLGIECIGEVEIDPSGTLLKGQKVAAFMGGMGRDFDGSYAEYALLPATILMPFESDLSWEILGALPEMFQTCYGSLHLALGIASGETLLIRGGTSSVGLLAAQMAKTNGLKVISTTRTVEKERFLLEKGVDRVLIDDGNLTEKIHKENLIIDKVLELVGTSTLKDSLHCIRPGGTVCMTGMLSEQWSIADFAPMEYIPPTVKLTSYDSGQLRVESKYFQQFLANIEHGKISPIIKHTFRLDQLVEAHRYMESNAGGGKIVVLT